LPEKKKRPPLSADVVSLSISSSESDSNIDISNEGKTGIFIFSQPLVYRIIWKIKGAVAVNLFNIELLLIAWPFKNCLSKCAFESLTILIHETTVPLQTVLSAIQCVKQNK